MKADNATSVFLLIAMFVSVMVICLPSSSIGYEDYANTPTLREAVNVFDVENGEALRFLSLKEQSRADLKRNDEYQ